MRAHTHTDTHITLKSPFKRVKVSVKVSQSLQWDPCTNYKSELCVPYFKFSLSVLRGPLGQSPLE